LKSTDAILFGYVTIKSYQNKTISNKAQLIKSGELRQAYCIRGVISELANTRFMLEKLNISAKIDRIPEVIETKKL